MQYIVAYHIVVSNQFKIYSPNRFTGSCMHCVCLCMYYSSVQWLLPYCATTNKCLFVYCSSVGTPVDQAGHQHKGNILAMLHWTFIVVLSTFLPLGEFSDVSQHMHVLYMHTCFQECVFRGILQTTLNRIHRYLISPHFLLQRDHL